MNKTLRTLALAPAAAAAFAFATPAFANSLTFQGVTFDTQSSGNTFTLTISNAVAGGTGNWANIQYIKAFEIKDIGNVTGVNLSNSMINDGWSATVNHGLSANAGCTTGGTPGSCFFQASSALLLTNLMTFTMTFQGSNLNFSAPSLKVQFFEQPNQANATGDLLSRTIPAIPEPEIYAMMALGLGLLGWNARRKKSKEAAAG